MKPLNKMLIGLTEDGEIETITTVDEEEGMFTIKAKKEKE